MQPAQHPIARFIEDAKMSQAAFAKAIGKIDDKGNGRQSYVSMLLHRLEKGRPVPADICPAIETATGGKVTRYDLRPDVFGEPPPKRKSAA